uniref:Uncharacterized protein n=1 Tax=Seriola dumerili TaxID=41447 RepID=A0A3B4TFB2_SERDU
MSDVRLSSASSTGSKVTGPSTGCSSPGNEPPAFVLPPRNARVALGGDARLEAEIWFGLGLKLSAVSLMFFHLQRILGRNTSSRPP